MQLCHLKQPVRLEPAVQSKPPTVRGSYICFSNGSEDLGGTKQNKV